MTRASVQSRVTFGAALISLTQSNADEFIVMLPFEDVRQAKDTNAAAKTDIRGQREGTNTNEEEDRTSVTPVLQSREPLQWLNAKWLHHEMS